MPESPVTWTVCISKKGRRESEFEKLCILCSISLRETGRIHNCFELDSETITQNHWSDPQKTEDRARQDRLSQETGQLSNHRTDFPETFKYKGFTQSPAGFLIEPLISKHLSPSSHRFACALVQCKIWTCSWDSHNGTCPSRKISSGT